MHGLHDFASNSLECGCCSYRTDIDNTCVHSHCYNSLEFFGHLLEFHQNVKQTESWWRWCKIIA